MLDEILEYHDTLPNDGFTDRVMRGVRRRQRQRRAILFGSGALGAAFGVAGMALLAEPLAQLFSGGRHLELSVVVMAAVALLGWLLHEEAGLNG